MCQHCDMMEQMAELLADLRVEMAKQNAVEARFINSIKRGQREVAEGIISDTVAQRSRVMRAFIEVGLLQNSIVGFREENGQEHGPSILGALGENAGDGFVDLGAQDPKMTLGDLITMLSGGAKGRPS